MARHAREKQLRDEHSQIIMDIDDLEGRISYTRAKAQAKALMGGKTNSRSAKPNQREGILQLQPEVQVG